MSELVAVFLGRLASEKGSPHELLRDGRSAGNDAPVTNHLNGGAKGRQPVHARMIPEPMILRGESRLHQPLRDFAIGHSMMKRASFHRLHADLFEVGQCGGVAAGGLME